MVGGETEIRRGDNSTIKAIGPGIGHVCHGMALKVAITKADMFSLCDCSAS